MGKINKVQKTKINTVSTNDEFIKLIRIILIVVVLFVAFYALTYFLTKKNNAELPNNDQDTVIQYNQILLGTLLNQPDEEYYVLATLKDDQWSSLYGTYLNLYKTTEKALPVYTSNLDDVLNAPFKAEKSNFKINKLTDLKLKEATLLHIKGKKLIGHYEGKDAIAKYLDTLIKK